MVVIGLMIAVGVSYPVVMRLVAVAVQPKRLEMARLGHSLIHNDEVADSTRRVIRMMIADAFDPRVAIMMVCVYPIFSVLKLLKHESTLPSEMPASLSNDFEKFKGLHALSIAAANPAFFLVLLFEVMILGAFFAPIAIFAGNSEKLDQIRMRNFAIIRSELALRQVHMAAAV